MGAWAGRTIDQDTFLGWMSNPDGWSYFVSYVLPDVATGKATVIGGDHHSPAPTGSVLAAVQASGNNLGGLTIPTSIYDAINNPTPVAPAPQAPTVDPNKDAKSALTDELNSWGLGGLADMAWNLLATGASHDQIVQEIRKTDVYKQRFAGNVQRQGAGLTPLSEAEYLAYETQARQVMRAAGLPPSFYDTPDDFANFIAKDVSASELNSRVQLGYTLLNQSPAETRQELQRLYGVSDGQMVAYLLDPDRALPAIERQIQAATSAGIAQITGYGQLGRTEAERVADLSTSETAARQGFADLAAKHLLTAGLSQEQQIEAEFGGNTEYQQQIERRRQSLNAAFTGGGQFATSQKGVGGLGSARSTAS